MVIIKKENILGIPLLHVVKHEKMEDKLPFVIFIHGIASIKERNLQYAYMLAEQGYRVILPDALYHGERLEEKHLHAEFWKVVLTTIHDIEVLKEFFDEQGLIEEGRIGVAGTSMGAIITLGAMAKYDWIQTAVSLMGNPAYIDFAKLQLQVMEQNNIKIPLTNEQIEEQLNMLKEYDATTDISEWNHRPLLFWHGKRDTTVPYEGAYNFYEQLKPTYEQKNIPLSFILDEQAGHVVPNKAAVEAVNWFVKYL
ncbi:prolyl oligopeptidase family serine peptidase [Bacillus massiliigorillae]|uniref:prolyl oligopeptidase family serine peptidase n=1 Tax=Bacillus massiliigorillae TaxID=1243664 RepID=UPI0003A1CF56|nr:prolyl oligopeptidase family serine peptidase [Bacillus massiliigorillae]